MNNTYSISTEEGSIKLVYYNNTVLINYVQGIGYEYLDALLYDINDKITKPSLILIPALESHTQLIRDNNFMASGIMLDKIELYYKGDKNQIAYCLYNWFADRDRIEPLYNNEFISTINSQYKTISYRLDTFIPV